MAVVERWLGGKKYLPGQPLPNSRDKRAAFSTPQISSDYAGYDCPVTGKWIEGRTAHQENLKRTNSRVVEPGETRDQHKKNEESFNDNLDRILDKHLPE